VIVVYIRNEIFKGATEILQMKERIWMGVRSNITSNFGLVISFAHNPPRSMPWYDPNFTKHYRRELKGMAYTNADNLVTGDKYSRIGRIQRVAIW
jgi:type IV secretory pathway TrbD component